MDTKWPNSGEIEFRNVRFRYQPNSPLVLKNISFKIRGGEKIGIVGRTVKFVEPNMSKFFLMI